ncbi:hypothetical protein [Zunongwangia sp. HRR-M8]|uniref:hypothetical protein n=1 Tax=Zunongwangia sp. HRR-M8 TaxID=3015170 RepID=UPI0022DE1B65|nr:hypothetical protein [Zunongwangia sp. HRR-M8]WBL21169.1 hypothetical protein PBT89_10530 [Zunongwangia sp. HRR-M8]
MMNTENNISTAKNFLINLTQEKQHSVAFEELITHFCGQVITKFSEIKNTSDLIRMYVLGDIAEIEKENCTFYIIEEFSFNYENLNSTFFKRIHLGEVPLNIHNAGVYYRKFFNTENYFHKIKTAHNFQQLTESNKQGKALRKGIYLTPITKTQLAKSEEELHFRLLRCSSNFTGPTENFSETDHHIVNKINEAVRFDFEQKTELNHVLAQIYENKKKDKNNPKDVKAKIKAHSDKTKDMPNEGLIAFCSFYDDTNIEKLHHPENNPFDWYYKKSSALTRLHFKLKPTVIDASLAKEFSITLYPNSVFLIPLSTNRLYTHEIRPSVLNVDQVPTRMGYVIRCSNLEAVYKNNQTFIKEKGGLIKLEPMNAEQMEDLRSTYFEENKSEKQVEYGKIHFSMNSGDYEKPVY